MRIVLRLLRIALTRDAAPRGRQLPVSEIRRDGRGLF